MARSLSGIPRLRKPAARPRGPALYKLNQTPRRLDNLFLNPPLTFDSPTTSNQEWIIYLAMALVTHSPKEPWLPPFNGGDDWQYQAEIEGARRIRGGQVVDFVYQERIGLRLQTTYWHLQQDSAKYFQDLALATTQQALPVMIDLWDHTYLPVGDGRRACSVVALALKEIQLPNPFRLGTLAPSVLGVA